MRCEADSATKLLAPASTCFETPHWVRVCLGVPTDELRAGLEALSSFLPQYRR